MPDTGSCGQMGHELILEGAILYCLHCYYWEVQDPDDERHHHK